MQGMDRHAAVPFWRDTRVLTVLGQVVFVLALASIGAFLYANLSSAMRQRGLVADLGFLRMESGFEIGESVIAYHASDSYGRAYLAGLLNTVLVSAVGIVLATILGVIVGVARLSGNWLVQRIAIVYIEVIRNTPLLVQLVFIYFGVFVKLPPVRESLQVAGWIFANQRGLFIPRPVASSSFASWLWFMGAGVVAAAILWWALASRPSIWKRSPAWSALLALIIPGLAWMTLAERPISLEAPVLERFNFRGGLSLSPEFSAVVTGLVIYTTAFIAEVVRGGIQAVKRGQIEAARAMGLSEVLILRLVVFPQALRVIVPPLTSQYLNLAKNSSLAVAIGFPDLFNIASTMANQTGQPVPVILLIMATYLAMSLFTSLAMNVYNRYAQILER